MKELQQEQYLDSIECQMIIKYSTHGIGVNVGKEKEVPFHSYLADIYLYNLRTRREVMIGECQLMKFDNTLNSDYGGLRKLSEYDSDLVYFSRLLERVYNQEKKNLIILNDKKFDAIWCLNSIAIHPQYRGLGLGEMVIENIQKVLFTKTGTNLIFGFAFPTQHWDGKYDNAHLYEAGNNLNLKQSEAKLKTFYKSVGFNYLEDMINDVNRNIAEAAKVDEKRSSHLFFKFY